MIGSFGSVSSPSTTCRSVRTRAQAAIPTSTWPGPGSGLGRRRRRGRPPLAPVLSLARPAARAAAPAEARARSGPGVGAGRGLRRLPHRSARRRWRAADPKLPLIPGHEIVGEVVACGAGRDAVRARASGSASPGSAIPAASAPIAAAGHENLCDAPGFTGYTMDGGYAELTVADAAYCFPIPERYGDAEAAPLLCAGPDRLPHAAHGRRRPPAGHLGLRRRRPHRGAGRAPRGPRALRLHPARRRGAQAFARATGCCLGRRRRRAAAGAELDAALIFAPVGSLVPMALAAVRKGGTVVCGGIHMSDIPSFPYRLLWGERVCARSPTSPAPMPRSSWRWPAISPIRTHVLRRSR